MVEDIVKHESKYINFVLFLISIWTYFNYFLPGNLSRTILVLSASALFIYAILNHMKIRITTSQISLLVVIFSIITVQLTSLVYSEYIESSIYKGFSIITILIIGMLLIIQSSDWQKRTVKYLLFFSLFHGMLTIISYLFPAIFNNFVLSLIPGQIKIDISTFMSNGFYSGITNQISINAFYISVGIGILFSNLLKNNRFNFNKELLLLVLMFAALLLTGKRGHLLAVMMSIVLVAGVDTRIKGKSFLNKIIKVTFVLFSTLATIIIVIPGAAAPIERFLEKQDGDLTSGRTDLILNAWDLFSQKPIFGWGTGTFSNLYGTGNHNIILQLLSENGIIGLITFLLFITFNFIFTLKKMKSNYTLGSREYDTLLLFSIYIQTFFMLYGLSGNVLNDEYILMVYVIGISIPYNADDYEDIKR